jgi:MHS family proline/betaine transporter-like MFS transporter
MSKKRLIFSSGIANSFEWYNYALFGHLATILSDKFFPEDDPSLQILNGFLLFAVGYIVRPLGGIIFGIIGDKLGRKKALTASIMCMAYPTALISILPTYESVGISATILMIIIRMMQGLSMGGALTGSVSFLMEHTDKHERGLLGSVPMASISIGILAGSLITFLIKIYLNDADFENWGWILLFGSRMNIPNLIVRSMGNRFSYLLNN